MKQFELIPHTADIQIRVYGATKDALFTHALIGLFHCLGPQFAAPLSRHTQRYIDLASHDLESLLVDFLSEAVYLSDVHNEAYDSIDFADFSDTHIRATLYGAPVTGFEVVEVKAVTYHDLHIQKINGLWQTDIVFDI